MTFKDMYFFHHVEFKLDSGATTWVTVKGQVIEAIGMRQWMVKYDNSEALQMVSLREMISRGKPAFRWHFFLEKAARDEEFKQYERAQATDSTRKSDTEKQC